MLLLAFVYVRSATVNPLLSVPFTSPDKLLWVRMQWSTNGSDIWNEEITREDFDDQWLYVVGGISDPCFFISKITSDDGYVDVWKKLEVTTYYQTLLYTNWQPLVTNEFYVRPNIFDERGTNLVYRPLLSITNYPPFVQPDTNNYPATTNPPPIP